MLDETPQSSEKRNAPFSSSWIGDDERNDDQLPVADIQERSI
jgi:hypothetical protein